MKKAKIIPIEKFKKKPSKEKKPEIPLTSEQQIVVEENQGLIGSVARHYLGQGLDFADLFSEGQFGLIRAVKKYDKKRGTQFSTYAVWWIWQAITRAIYDKAAEIRIPVHTREKIRKLYKQEVKIWTKLGRPPYRYELAEAMKMSEKEINDLMMLARGIALSLNAERTEDGGTLEDIVPDYKITSAETVVSQQLAKVQIEKLLECLTNKQEKVLRMRFGIGYAKEHTLDEIGKEMGVTRERIRQIEKKALQRLSREARRKIIKPVARSLDHEEEMTMKRDRQEVVKKAKEIHEDQRQGLCLDKLAKKYKISQSNISLMLGLARDQGVQKHYLGGLNISTAYALVGLPPEEQDKYACKIKEKSIKKIAKEIVARKKELGVRHCRTTKIKAVTEAKIVEVKTKIISNNEIASEHKINGNGNMLETKDSIRCRAMLIIKSLDEIGLDGRSAILVKQGQILLSELELMQLELGHTKNTV